MIEVTSLSEELKDQVKKIKELRGFLWLWKKENSIREFNKRFKWSQDLARS